VIECHFLRGREVNFFGNAFGEHASEPCMSPDAPTRDVYELLIRRSQKLVGNTDAKRRHVIEEKVGPMLGRDDDQHVRPRGFEAVTQSFIGTKDGLRFYRRR